MSILGSLAVKVGTDLSGLAAGLRKANAMLDDFAKNAKNTAKYAGVAFVGMAGGLGLTVKLASDAEEQMNVLRQSFGKLEPVATKWADETADAVGRSKVQMRGFLGDMQALLAPMLGNKDAAFELSKGLSKMAVDLGSFHNVVDENALAALRAGIIGSTEPLLNFGIDLRESSLAAFAQAEGIKASVKEMSNAEKAGLRYALILKTTKDKQNDAQRTADGLANASKGLVGALYNIGVQIGQVLLPYVARIVSKLRDWAKWVSKLPPGVVAFGTKLAVFTSVVTGVTAALWGLVAVAPLVRTVIIATAKPFLVVAGIIAGLILIIGALRMAWDADLLDMRKGFQNLVNDIKFEINIMIDAFKKLIDRIAETIIAFRALAASKSVKTARMAVQAFRAAGGAGGAFGGALEIGKESFKEGAGVVKEGVVERILKPIAQTWDTGVKTILEAAGISADKAASDAFDFEGARFDFDEFMKKVKGVSEPTGNVASKMDRLDAILDSVTKKGVDPAKQRAAASAMLRGTGIVAQPVGQMTEEETERFREAHKPLVTRLKQAAVEMAQDIGIASAQFGQTLVSSMGEAGQVVQAGVEGFKSGGVFGAIIGVLAQLVMRSQGFKEAVNHANQMLERLVKAFSPLADAMKPLAAQTNLLVALIGELIGPIFEKLRPVFDFFFQVTRVLVIGLLKIIRGIGQLWNGLISAIQWVFQKLASFKVFGKRPFGFMDKWAKSLERGKINLNGVNRAIKEFEELTLDAAREVGRATEGKDKESDAVEELTEQLLNVPSGFKIAQRRFEASVGAVVDSMVNEGNPLAAGAGGGTTINIGTVEVPDVDAFIRRLQEAEDMQTYMNTGSSEASDAQFSTPRRSL